MGLAVALDDFGGAFGSARVLRDISFSAVKLDPLLTAGVTVGLPEGPPIAAATPAPSTEEA